MISESLYFVYDGIRSGDMGVINVTKSIGMQEESFLPNRNIIKENIRGRSKSYLYDVSYSPLVIKLRFAFENTWDSEKIRDVARWLCQDYYKELYFSDNLERKYYAMYVGDPSLIHNSLKHGYIDIEMENIDAFTYSPVFESKTYDYSSNSINGTDFTFYNTGDQPCSPILYINKVGTGDDIKIINFSNKNQEFILSNLQDGEIVTVDNENKEIETDLPLTYRYDDHNGTFIEMPRGKNQLKIYGNCKIKWKYQFRTLQG